MTNGPGAEQAADRVWTIPNVLSMLRLVGVPVFLWAILEHDDTLALLILMGSGISDYLDGKIARRFGLVSQLGAVLDPVADRLYILSTLLGLAWREIIPWWLVAVLLAREVLLTILLLIARTKGLREMPVHFVGKAATFNLLYAFPLLLLADGDGTLASIARPVGWGFAWWGIVLYWLAGLMYAASLRRYLRARTLQPVSPT
ncbi:CDP-alcohol phosphatidyltransferase family protein [Nostocoides veronense]|uniref:CDP-alcohol phosphatidyltransferase family protein n=1 Tax=Nostocoides veronense TaxID=330836 RepID=A0ABN2LEE9_9MICO